ncbi:hypothetical protein C8Q76DRAFT_483526 [Earliella scabrosa]|nr:hypothetical protein C8Q76DRAFT_483526 [Earliella scabrosa]
MRLCASSSTQMRGNQQEGESARAQEASDRTRAWQVRPNDRARPRCVALYWFACLSNASMAYSRRNLAMMRMHLPLVLRQSARHRACVLHGPTHRARLATRRPRRASSDRVSHPRLLLRHSSVRIAASAIARFDLSMTNPASTNHRPCCRVKRTRTMPVITSAQLAIPAPCDEEPDDVLPTAFRNESRAPVWPTFPPLVPRKPAFFPPDPILPCARPLSSDHTPTHRDVDTDFRTPPGSRIAISRR